MLGSLNPYCSGQWSRTALELFMAVKAGKSLNPYCSGQWSRTAVCDSIHVSSFSLNPYCSGQWPRTS